MSRRSPLMKVMTSAIMKVTRSLRRDFNEVEKLQVSRKGPSDFVTTADRRVEKELFEELSRVRPDFGFLMEESGAVKPDAQSRFIIDPIDGTTNFLHGVPHFAVSVAAEERGEIIAAATYSPLIDEFFWAEKGSGAFLNDTRLRVAGRERLDDALLATGIPFRGRPGHDAFLAQAGEVMSNVAGIRRFGAATLDLAYVAAGRFDGFWEQGLQPWDLAAGILLVREAGGYVTDMMGGQDMLKRGDIIVANDRLHGPLQRMLRRAQRRTDQLTAAGGKS